MRFPCRCLPPGKDIHGWEYLLHALLHSLLPGFWCRARYRYNDRKGHSKMSTRGTSWACMMRSREKRKKAEKADSDDIQMNKRRGDDIRKS